jgi:hypothetical protein
MLNKTDNTDRIFKQLPDNTVIYSWNRPYPICYIACEIHNDVCLMHFYIPKEYKAKSNIDLAKNELFPAVCKALKEQGIEFLTTNCNVQDTKTSKLFRDVGFMTQNLTVGIYKLEE